MGHHLSEIIRVYRIQNVHKELAVGTLGILVLVLEVDVECVVGAEVYPHPLN